MASAREAASSDLLKLRKERVHSTMLVEVLALLIFMAFMFAFVLRDEAANTNVWKQKHDRVAAELLAAKREVVQLKRLNTELERANRQLLRDITGTIPANDTLVITKSQWRELIAKLAASERRVGQLEDQLGGRGGVDLPPCPGIEANFVVKIRLVQGGYSVTPNWPPSAAPVAREITGLTELASGRMLSSKEFLRLGRQVRAWGEAQSPKCGFRAEVFTTNGVISVSQKQTVDSAFYTAIR